MSIISNFRSPETVDGCLTQVKHSLENLGRVIKAKMSQRAEIHTEIEQKKVELSDIEHEAKRAIKAQTIFQNQLDEIDDCDDIVLDSLPD